MKSRSQNTNEKLIPFEKRKNIIKLDKRGRESRTGIVSAVLTGAAGIFCLVYCLAIYFFMGYGTKFFLIWGVMALGFGILSFLFGRPRLLERIPRIIRIGFRICALLGVLLFITVEGLILSMFCAGAEPGADFLIVLGAQWKNNGPSYVLQKRLDRAVDYLKANPDTNVIVSGGQGSNEPMSEAAGMAGYLEAAGIEAERIMQEASSTNTNENLAFSAAFLDKTGDRVVIVTNNFHVFRAVKIAQKQGYARVEGLAAGAYPAMAPNNLFREFFGVVKDFCVGNL